MTLCQNVTANNSVRQLSTWRAGHNPTAFCEARGRTTVFVNTVILSCLENYAIIAFLFLHKILDVSSFLLYNLL